MTDLDGFAGAVTFSCSGLPAESQCVFSPASLSGTGSTSLTITTHAKTGMLKPGLLGHRWSFAFAMFGTMLGGVFVLGLPRGRHRRRKTLLAVLLGALAASCGGGGGNNHGPPPDPGTPQGLYTVTVTANRGATTHSTRFQLGVY